MSRGRFRGGSAGVGESRVRRVVQRRIARSGGGPFVAGSRIRMQGCKAGERAKSEIRESRWFVRWWQRVGTKVS